MLKSYLYFVKYNAEADFKEHSCDIINHFRYYKLLFVDEAQKIPDIGLKLKLMIDEIKGLRIIVSGSSSFDISQNVGEPLTGRKYSFNLFGLSESEFGNIETPLQQQEKDWVEEREGGLFAYAFKWKNTDAKVPTQWKVAYPNATFKVIHHGNFYEWLK